MNDDRSWARERERRLRNQRIVAVFVIVALIAGTASLLVFA